MVMAVEHIYRDVYHLGDYVVEIYREGFIPPRWLCGDYTVGNFWVEVAGALLFHGKTYGYFRGGASAAKNTTRECHHGE